jgi:DNA-binding XRE family transcriptional regulator
MFGFLSQLEDEILDKFPVSGTLRKKIIFLRVQYKKWSKTQAAREAGLHLNTIYAIEAGKKNAGPESIVKLAKAFGVETGFLTDEFLLTPEEIERIKQYLMQNYRQMASKQMAGVLGVSKNTVDYFLSCMYESRRLTPRSGKHRKMTPAIKKAAKDRFPWTKKIEKRLKELWQQGKNDTRIGLLLNIPANLVQSKRQRLGLYNYQFWQDYEIEILRRYYDKLPASILARVLNFKNSCRVKKKIIEMYDNGQLQRLKRGKTRIPSSWESRLFADRCEGTYGVYALDQEMLGNILLLKYKDLVNFSQLIHEALASIALPPPNKAFFKLLKLIEVAPEVVNSLIYALPEYLRRKLFRSGGGATIKDKLAIFQNQERRII